MSDNIIKKLSEFEIPDVLKRIQELKLSNGGFPNQFSDDKKSGAWATANVLLLHRKFNFLSDNDVSDAINYLLKVYCISSEGKKWFLGNGERQSFGWGSFTDKDNKHPIPIITSFVLLALCGYQNLHNRLSQLFKLSAIWLISQQNETGYWGEKEDCYANMCIINCLLELKKIYKNSDHTLYSAIENKISKSKDYYKSVDINDVGESKVIFFKIINCLLKNDINQEIHTPKKFDLIFDDVTKNSTIAGENFGYEKASIIYFLHLAVIDKKFFVQHSDSLCKVLSLLKGKQPETGLWVKDKRGCLWFTCDILILLNCVDNFVGLYGQHHFYRESCNMFFKMPWYVSTWEYIKIFFRIGSRLNKTVKMYRILG